MSSKGKALPFLAVLVAAVTWGFSFLFTKEALKFLEPFQLLGYRFLVAAAVLAVLAACGAVRLNLTRPKLMRMLPVALLQPVAYFVCETLGVSKSTVAEAGIIIGLAPIAITLCSVWLLKERLSADRWAAIALSVAGVAVIVLNKEQGTSGKELVGPLFLLGAVAAAGFYNPLSRKASGVSTPMEITFVMMCVGAVTFNGIGVVLHKGGFASYFGSFTDPTVLLQVAYLGVLSSVVAFFCLNYALSKLESSTVGTFINLTPIITVFAGVFLAGDHLLLWQFVGAAMVLAGIWWMAHRQAEAARAPCAAARSDLPAQPE